MIGKYKKNHLLVDILLSVGIILSGCSQDKTPPPQNTANVVEQAESETEQGADTEGTQSSEETTPDAGANQNTETKAITISVLNLSNVQIGMFSVIDPATGEQINLDNVAPEESVSMECNWPSDTAQFQWALYNMNGELCMEASTDISKAKKSVTLILTGENTIEDVQAFFDK